MSLQQPTSIIPSSLTPGYTTVDASDDILISWNVSGDVMTAFSITVYPNTGNTTTDAAAVHTTGIIQETFTGVDRYGNSVAFAYEPGVTWSSWGLSNGSDYTVSITQYFGGLTDASHTVTQYSPAAFSCRVSPSVTLDPFATPVSTVSQTFTASASLPAGASIRWARWRFGIEEQGEVTVLADTGEVVTSVLSYTADGMMTGSDYAVSLTIETTDGVQATTGFVSFPVEYTQVQATGDISATWLPDQDCAAVTFGRAVNIPASATGPYALSGGSVSLPSGSTIAYDEANGSPMNYPAPFTIGWRGSVEAALTRISELRANNAGVSFGADVAYPYGSGTIGSGAAACAVSPDGTLLLVGGNGVINKCVAYSLDGTSATYLGYMTEYGVSIGGNPTYSGNVTGISFSPSGSLLAVTTTSAAYLYAVSGTSIRALQTLNAYGGGAFDGNILGCAFSADGTFLALCGAFSERCVLYTLSDTSAYYYRAVMDGTDYLDGAVYGAEFLSDGITLALVGSFTQKAVLAPISGGSVTTLTGASFTTYPAHLCIDRVSLAAQGLDIICTAEDGGNTLDIWSSAGGSSFTYIQGRGILTPIYTLDAGGGLVCVGGAVYDHTTDTVSILYSDSGTGTINGSVTASGFSAGGDILAIAGAFTGNLKLYTGGFVNAAGAEDAAFSADGTRLAVACYDGEYAHIYVFSVSGAGAVYLGDAYSDSGLTDAALLCVTFSPDGTMLAVGGNGNGAHVFTADQSADSGFSYAYSIMQSGYVQSLSFSPNGALLAVAGDFTGYAQMYEVTSSAATLVETITRAGSAYTTIVKAAKFAPWDVEGDYLLAITGYSAGAAPGLFTVTSSGNCTFLGKLINGAGGYSLDFNAERKLLAATGVLSNTDFSDSPFSVAVFDFSDGTNAVFKYGLKTPSNALSCSFDETGHSLACALQSGSEVILGVQEDTFELSITQNVTPSFSGAKRAVFNPDADALAICGTGGASIYRVRDSVFLTADAGGEITLQAVAAGILLNTETDTLYVMMGADESSYDISVSPSTVAYNAYAGDAAVASGVFNADGLFDGPLSGITLAGRSSVDTLYVVSDDTDLRGAEPVWSGDTILYASYVSSIDGGTVDATDASYALYRKDGADSTYKAVYTMTGNGNTILDWGVKSLTEYAYELFYETSGAYSTPSESSSICRAFRAYTLLETEPDANYPNVYHVLNIWRFGNNVEAGSVSNNNQPNFLTNFTPYRYKQMSSRNGRSGTLSALLSNASNGIYADTAAQMDKLFAVSKSVNTFFLKDMKGNLYEVAIAGPITCAVNHASWVMPTTVSVPWEEIGDASGVSIIQTADDLTQEQNGILSVTLQADASAASLFATYPSGYKGSTLSISGRDLVSETPDGMQVPSYTLAEGDLTASLGE